MGLKRITKIGKTKAIRRLDTSIDEKDGNKSGKGYRGDRAWGSKDGLTSAQGRIIAISSPLTVRLMLYLASFEIYC